MRQCQIFYSQTPSNAHLILECSRRRFRSLTSPRWLWLHFIGVPTLPFPARTRRLRSRLRRHRVGMVTLLVLVIVSPFAMLVLIIILLVFPPLPLLPFPTHTRLSIITCPSIAVAV